MEGKKYQDNVRIIIIEEEQFVKVIKGESYRTEYIVVVAVHSGDRITKQKRYHAFFINKALYEEVLSMSDDNKLDFTCLVVHLQEWAKAIDKVNQDASVSILEARDDEK